jgi:hypothetical protein
VEIAAVAMSRFFTVLLLMSRCVKVTTPTVGRKVEWPGRGR